MPYTFAHNLSLGTSKSGLTTLRCQLMDVLGNNIGSAISTGFVDTGSGTYIWSYDNFPDDFRGGIKVYDNSFPLVTLALLVINPEEGEYIDMRVSEIISQNEKTVNIKVNNGEDIVNIKTEVSDETISILPGVQ